MPATDRALWHMEFRMSQPMTLEVLARHCGVSPHHLSRGFRAATGMSPMRYLRARRLSLAARRLAQGDEGILTVALDLQYGSHEAFTRAFVAQFGIPPKAVREEGRLSSLDLQEAIRMDTETGAALDAPDIRRSEGFEVIGLDIDCSGGAVAGIPQMWEAFNARDAEVAAVEGAAAFGVCHGADGEGGFRYLAGLQSRAGAGVPDGMARVRVPAGRHAVWTHQGHVSDLPALVGAIWNGGLEAAGLTHRRAPDFERYDARFDPATGRGAIEVWVPVE